MSLIIDFFTQLINTLIKENTTGSIGEIEEIMTGSLAIYPTDSQTTPPDPALVIPTPNLGEIPETIVWEPEKTKQPKTALTPCIVIDKNDRWHGNAKVDTTNINTSDFQWGYYGKNYPVFVESPDGKLEPFYLPEAAGECSNRLYKGANPSGFKATFRHRNDTLRKVQIGLMVALVLGLFFMMFLFLDWK